MPTRWYLREGKETEEKGLLELLRYIHLNPVRAGLAKDPKVYPGGAASINRGKSLFTSIGCALCHTPTLYTGNATVAALRNRPVQLYSDLLLHEMGPGLQDGISQGQAGPKDFRTAPLWGFGQRIFFLHDGRTSDLVEAIQSHQSGAGRNASEANAVVSAFNGLSENEKQDLLNFLRSL